MISLKIDEVGKFLLFVITFPLSSIYFISKEKESEKSIKKVAITALKVN